MESSSTIEFNSPLSTNNSPLMRKPFLLRVDPKLLEQLQRWADDDLRSLNGQIEFLLRKALRDAGREKDSQMDASSTKKAE